MTFGIPLLTLPPHRVAAELRFAEAQAAADAAWSTRLRRLRLGCLIGFAIGLVIAYSSMGLTGPSAAIALWGGLAIGDGAVLAFLLAMWALEGE